MDTNALAADVEPFLEHAADVSLLSAEHMIAALSRE